MFNNLDLSIWNPFSFILIYNILIYNNIFISFFTKIKNFYKTDKNYRIKLNKKKY
jgi:hypothetical protein